jgi:hypothetical protein
VAVEFAGGDNRIQTYHVDDALEKINQSENGAHHLIIYPELRMLRELYTNYIKTQLEHEHKIVLILPHYEIADNLRKILFGTDEETIKKYEIRL